METVLSDLVAGRCSREDAADWAQAVSRSSGGDRSFEDQLEDDISREAYSALAVADRSEADLETRQAPYFIREEDLREWLASLRGEDSLEISPRGLRLWRPHQARKLSTQLASVDVRIGDLSRRAGVRTIRGKDDLDCYEAILIEMPDGVQASLISHVSSQMVEIHLERTAIDLEAELLSLQAALEINPELVIWRDLDRYKAFP